MSAVYLVSMMAEKKVELLVVKMELLSVVYLVSMKVVWKELLSVVHLVSMKAES